MVFMDDFKRVWSGVFVYRGSIDKISVSKLSLSNGLFSFALYDGVVFVIERQNVHNAKNCAGGLLNGRERARGLSLQ